MDFMGRHYGVSQAAFYAAPNFGKREAAARRAKFSVKDLSDLEFDTIMAGQAALVEDVLLPTEGQAWLFSNDHIISSDFYIQALFKVNGMIKPQAFHDHIDGLIKRYDILRTIFLCGDSTRPLRVVLKVRTAEIRFHDLSNLTADGINFTLEKIMAADRRRGFNLENDRLLRIGVFKTAIKEYAVLVAQPQVIADSWDFGLIFSGMFLDEETTGKVARKLKNKDFSFSKYLIKRGEQDKTPAIQYWRDLLANLTWVSQLPGYKVSNLPYQQSVSVLTFDHAITKTMQEMTKSNTGFIALLQTAWGIMLQHYNKSNDAVYGVILSNRSAKLDNIEDVASIINVMPIRVTCPINMTVEDLGKKQQMQLLLSQPYSYCTPKELQEISALQEPLFNHFLNFHSFGAQECYTELEAPFGVTPVSVNSFDYRNANLGIYFRMICTELSVEFVYDQGCFSKRQIELLQQGLLAVIRQIIQKPQMQICEVKMPSLEQIIEADVDDRTIKAEITAFLGEVDIFSNLPDAVIAELVSVAKSEYFVEGDVICSEGQKQEKFYLVYSGTVEISRSAETGWSKKLKLLETGSVLGYESIFDQRASSIRAEALKGDVTMIAIPNKELCKVLHKNYDLMVNIVMALNKQVNNFQKLWVSAK